MAGRLPRRKGETMANYLKRMRSTGDDKYDFTKRKQGGTKRAKAMLSRKRKK